MTTSVGTTHRVAVVVASINASTTAAACLSRFRDETKGRGEVILVDASDDGTAAMIERDFADVRLIRKTTGALAPDLWRDGLEATDAPLVAFTTAAMVPTPGWLDALLTRLDATGAAAVGGPIEPSERLSPTDRAVYLLRYVNYLRPLGDPEPPGDNALYSRDRLTGLEDVIARGFWETEIHRRLVAKGETLAMASGAAVTFHGGGRFSTALQQRHRHARHYGATRANRMGSPERLARAAAFPLVPMVLTRRIVSALRARGRAFGPWLPALPGLSLLMAAWAAGEATGTWRGFAPDARAA